MAVMRAVGYHALPPHARVRETEQCYIVELDVADFTAGELSILALGPVITVRGEQCATEADEGLPFRIRERLEETFRLPDDADLTNIEVFFKHGVLVLAVTRIPLEPRLLQITRRRSGLLNPDAEAV